MLTLALINKVNQFHELEDLLRCWYFFSYPDNYTLRPNLGPELSSGSWQDCNVEQHTSLLSFASQVERIGRVQTRIYASRTARAGGSRIIQILWKFINVFTKFLSSPRPFLIFLKLLVVTVYLIENCPQLFIQHITTCPPYLGGQLPGSFLPQPKETACCDEKEVSYPFKTYWSLYALLGFTLKSCFVLCAFIYSIWFSEQTVFIYFCNKQLRLLLQ